MAKERTSVRMQAQIKLMSEQGYSIRAIARTLKIARKTVRRILGITLAESSESPPWIGTVDWDYVRQPEPTELSRETDYYCSGLSRRLFFDFLKRIAAEPHDVGRRHNAANGTVGLYNRKTIDFFRKHG